MKMDGKNREEQENGAKVRDLEEYKAENRKRKRRRRITVGILAGAILAAGIGTGVWLQLRTFQGYDTVQATETEDTDTYMFQKSGNKIVRYGIDGIELRDRKNQTLWSDHYTMENPQMISCGDAIAIYDKNGTKIVVYDADGKAGEIAASYPIVKASVAGQGSLRRFWKTTGRAGSNTIIPMERRSPPLTRTWTARAIRWISHFPRTDSGWRFPTLTKTAAR